MRARPVTSLRAPMEGYSRDLLRGIGKGDAPPREQRPTPPPVEMEEVELSLGLSLGGRFGLERKGDKLARSSSVAAVLMTPEAVAAPRELATTSSLPAKAEAAEMGRKLGLNGWSSSFRENGGFGMEAAARLPASGSPSSGSSDGEGQRSQDPLMRTTSLPAVIDDEYRKRKAASLKRLELKKKRIERRNSLTSNIPKEAAEQILEEMNANSEKLESCDEVVTRNKQNLSNDKHPMIGRPPMHHATFTSRDCSLSTMRKKPNSAFKGTAGAEEHSPSSAVPTPGEGANGTTAATPPPVSSVAARAAALGSRGDQQHGSGRVAARAKSMGDAERTMVQEMPWVSTKGHPNGNRVEGFLYKYRNGQEVRIVCVCHGIFLTPAEFVKHAGGDNVANPLRHIIVNPTPQCFL